eukprot:TRINITY_DN312_c3_g1_i1.p1 TRINITY_DN312_c3_g1~~TRINITY_DN312_c3_g1_i1.p1  ORF type:complete len:338 (-),score=82.27 TRINITY_DN312_c3_g1_i1:48-1061(-)
MSGSPTTATGARLQKQRDGASWQQELTTAMSNTQPSDHNTVQLLSTHINHPQLCDVIFRCATTTTLSAHHQTTASAPDLPTKDLYALRGLLAMRSPVFRDMFFPQSLSANTLVPPERERMPVVVLSDITADAFWSVLAYVYTGRLQIGAELVMDAVFAANKFQIHGLADECTQWVQRHLSTDNCCLLLDEAMRHTQQVFVQRCVVFVCAHAAQVLLDRAFGDLCAQSVCAVLQSDDLAIDEATVFKAIVWWAASECGRRNIASSVENKRAVLTDILPLVRFPLMSCQEVVSLVKPTNLLPADTLVELLSYLVDGCSPPAFSCVPRKCQKQVVGARGR